MIWLIAISMIIFIIYADGLSWTSSDTTAYPVVKYQVQSATQTGNFKTYEVLVI